MSIPTPTLNLPVHTYPYPKLTLKIMQIYFLHHNLIGSMFHRYTGPHFTAAHRENLRCSRWPGRHWAHCSHKGMDMVSNNTQVGCGA